MISKFCKILCISMVIFTLSFVLSCGNDNKDDKTNNHNENNVDISYNDISNVMEDAEPVILGTNEANYIKNEGRIRESEEKVKSTEYSKDSFKRDYEDIDLISLSDNDNTINDVSGENYEDYGVNPAIDTEKENTSTFSIDVDTGSYTIARRFLTDNNRLPTPQAVRPEEFINYFDYNYDIPKNDDFLIQTELAPSMFKKDKFMMRIGIQGRDVPDEKRKRANLVFLIDVSGSMRTSKKLPLVKESMKMLLDSLKPDDMVGIAVYAGEADVYMKSLPIKEKEKIREYIDKLDAGGSTNAEGGIKIAYEMVSEKLIDDGINRVILCSDGDANVGRVTPDELLTIVDDYRKDLGITLSTFGYGMGNYNDTFMEQLANKGDGNYGYIDSSEEAERTFGEDLKKILEVIARDVKIQVVFNKDYVKTYRLVGYENRKLNKEDFEKYDVDAGEVGPLHNVTALYELEMRNQKPEGNLVEVRMRWKDASKSEEGEGREVKKLNKMVYDKDIKTDIEMTSPYYRLACCIGEFAEVLRQSQYAKDVDFESLLMNISIAESQLSKSDEKFKELLDLVRKAGSIKGTL